MKGSLSVFSFLKGERGVVSILVLLPSHDVNFRTKGTSFLVASPEMGLTEAGIFTVTSVKVRFVNEGQTLWSECIRKLCRSGKRKDKRCFKTTDWLFTTSKSSPPVPDVVIGRKNQGANLVLEPATERNLVAFYRTTPIPNSLSPTSPYRPVLFFGSLCRVRECIYEALWCYQPL